MLRWHLLKINKKKKKRKKITFVKGRLPSVPASWPFDFPGFLFQSKLKFYLTWEICTMYYSPLSWLVPPPHWIHLWISPPVRHMVSLTTSMAMFMFHKANVNNAATVFRKIHVSTSLLKDVSNPVLPSCELYSFLVVYICTFLCVAVEGSWLEGLRWCILIHQFGLNWTFIGYYAESSALGEILPVVRDFCSLYLVRFVPPPSLLLTHEEQAEWGRTFGGVTASEHGSGVKTAALPSLLLSSLLFGQHCPLLNMLWLSNACILTVWDCFCLLYVPLHYATPTCCTLITDCVFREK